MIKREELTNPASCMSRARDDEMTFVLLGRDAAAPFAIRAWVNERIRLGKNKLDDPQIVEALECAATMENQRRIILAKKKNREGLSDSELAEFNRLQQSVDAYLQSACELPKPSWR